MQKNDGNILYRFTFFSKCDKIKRVKGGIALKKKKLLYVAESFGGGVFTYLSELCTELCSKYDIYVAYSERSETPGNFKKYFPPEVKFIRLKYFKREISLANEIRACGELKDVIEEICPDIVHLHSTKAGVIGRIALFGKKLPVFYTPHGYAFHMAEAGKAKKAMYRMIEKVCALGGAVTVACSKDEYLDARKLSGRCRLVENGINCDFLDSITLETDKVDTEPFTVYTLGRICAHKNPQLFNSIAERMPNVRFLWIGDGEERDKLTAKNITVSGWVDRNEALRLAAKCHVFLMTSLGEGLPLSLVESMYMRKICVGNNVRGIREILRNGDNGFLCSSVAEFVSAISVAENGGEKTVKIIENAVADVKNYYNTSIMGKKYLGIYENY